MQVKATMRHNYATHKMAKICLPIQSKSNKSLQLMEVKRGTTLWKIVYHSLVKLKINITPDPAVSFLGIFSRKMNAHVYQGTIMFTTALLVIALN